MTQAGVDGDNKAGYTGEAGLLRDCVYFLCKELKHSIRVLQHQYGTDKEVPVTALDNIMTSKNLPNPEELDVMCLTINTFKTIMGFESYLQRNGQPVEPVVLQIISGKGSQASKEYVLTEENTTDLGAAFRRVNSVEEATIYLPSFSLLAIKGAIQQRLEPG